MKACRASGILWGAGLPLAILQHPGLVVLGDGLATTFADVGRRFRLTAFPAQLFKPQPLAVRAVRARHEEPALIRRIELPLDRAGPGNRRRRDDQDLAPGKGAGTRLGQRNRIAFTLDIERIAIHLIQEQVTHRHRAQTDRAVGAGHHQHPAMELLGQDGVARVAAARRGDALLDGGALFDQRIDALLGCPLGHLDRRPHRHHGARCVVDHVADPVQAQLRPANLRTFHEHHPLDR